MSATFAYLPVWLCYRALLQRNYWLLVGNTRYGARFGYFRQAVARAPFYHPYC